MIRPIPLVLALVSFAVAARAQGADHPPCSLATLLGAYGFIHDGIVFDSGTHMAEVGVARFDGKGHWGHEATLMRNGEVQRVRADGTYTVNPDCTGSAELRGSRVFTFDFVILNGGREVIQVATRSDRSVTWEMRKQDVGRCSSATLQGAYAIQQSGFDMQGNAKAGVGVATFDGKGTWSLKLTEVHRDRPVVHIQNPKGTYAVHANCTAEISLAGTPVGTANWAGVIVGTGEEVFEIATRPARGAVLWSLKRQWP